MRIFIVTLRRRNGRVVMERVVHSRYAAKRVARMWEATHDPVEYYTEVTET